jgi:hypothetical protein
MPETLSQRPSDPLDMSAFAAARALDCPVCTALIGDECVFTTAPVSVPVVPGTDVRPVRGYHAARLDAAGADVAVALGPSAVVWDNGDAPRLPVRSEAADRDAAQDVLSSLKERVDNLGADLGSLSAVLAGPRGAVAELADRMLGEPDDSETYCAVCGQWIGMFCNLTGWHHFTGDPAPGGYRNLYDADHDAVVAAMTPPGRALCPADLRLICRALTRVTVSYTEHEAGARAAVEALAERIDGYLGGIPSANAAGGAR